jgi:hypothetical protein
MARERNLTTSGAARPALGAYRDSDFEDFVVAVRDLPNLADEEGRERTIGIAQTQLASQVSILAVGEAKGKEAIWARDALSVFLERGVLELMMEHSDAGYRCQTLYIRCVEHECVRAGVRAVFERSAVGERLYVPDIPRA